MADFDLGATLEALDDTTRRVMIQVWAEAAQTEAAKGDVALADVYGYLALAAAAAADRVREYGRLVDEYMAEAAGITIVAAEWPSPDDDDEGA